MLVSPRWPSIRGELVFHQTTRWRDNNAGGQHRSLRGREERSSKLIQWRFNRAQGSTHLHIEHSWHSGQVSVRGVPSANMLVSRPCHSNSFLSPVTAVSTTAPPLHGTFQPQQEPGLKLQSWHRHESSLQSNLQVRRAFWTPHTWSMSTRFVSGFNSTVRFVLPNNCLLTGMKHKKKICCHCDEYCLTLSFLSSAVWESLKLPLLYGVSASIGNPRLFRVTVGNV